jgi:hypothetical protein
MRAVKERAWTMLGEFERAWTELVGKAVILSDGKVGDNADADPPAIVGLVPISEQCSALPLPQAIRYFPR